MDEGFGDFNRVPFSRRCLGHDAWSIRLRDLDLLRAEPLVHEGARDVALLLGSGQVGDDVLLRDGGQDRLALRDGDVLPVLGAHFMYVCS